MTPIHIPNPIFQRSILISSHIHLGLSSGLLPSGFSTRILYVFLISLCALHVSPISSKSEVQCNITYQAGLEKWGVASYPPNLDDHPLSAVRNYLFYIRNYVSRPEACSNRSLRTRIAMATRGRLNGVVLQQSIKVTDKTNIISVHCYYNQDSFIYPCDFLPKNLNIVFVQNDIVVGSCIYALT